MTYAYLLKPRGVLTSANEVTPEHCYPHFAAEVRAAVDAALYGVDWTVDPATGAALRGAYDGPGGQLELLLGMGHPEILLLRASEGPRTERLVRSLCDRTGWTRVDLQTLGVAPPRAVPPFSLRAA